MNCFSTDHPLQLILLNVPITQCLATWESFLTSQTDLPSEEDSEEKL